MRVVFVDDSWWSFGRLVGEISAECTFASIAERYGGCNQKARFRQALHRIALAKHLSTSLAFTEPHPFNLIRQSTSEPFSAPAEICALLKSIPLAFGPVSPALGSCQSNS